MRLITARRLEVICNHVEIIFMHSKPLSRLIVFIPPLPCFLAINENKDQNRLGIVLNCKAP